MNWFISFNTHAFIKSNWYTEKLLHSESMQAGIVLYPHSLSLSFSFSLLLSPLLFLSLSLSLSLSLFSVYLIIHHRVVNPPKFEANESRLEDYTAAGIRIGNFLFLLYFCSDFCLINTRMEGKAVETYRRYRHCLKESETRRWEFSAGHCVDSHESYSSVVHGEIEC